MSCSRQAYVLPSDSIADSTRKLCYGKIRRGNSALLRTIEGLNEEEKICKRRHRDEKSDLKQIIHHLNYQREGKGESVSIKFLIIRIVRDEQLGCVLRSIPFTLKNCFRKSRAFSADSDDLINSAVRT